MDIKQLRAMLAIAETGTMTGAATLLNAVQPAISRKIKLLEEELGTPLFAREHSGMILTEAGHILVKHARRIIHEVEQARQLIQPKKNDIEGVVTIGLMRSTYERYSGSILGVVKEHYKRISLKIIVGYSSNIQSWVKAGDVDAAILNLLHPSPGLDASPILSEHLCLVGLPDRGLAMDRPVSFRELHEADVFIPGYIAELQETIANATTRTGVYPRLRIETTSACFRQNLEKNGGFAILPASSISPELERRQLCAAPIVELTRTLSLAHPTSHAPRFTTNSVMHLILELMGTSVAEGLWPSATWLRSHPR